MKNNYLKNIGFYIIIFLFVLALVKSFIVSFYGLDLLDLGQKYHLAMRILNGEVAYRDFFLVYPPGDVYFPAGIFWLFGPKIIVLRIVTSVLFAMFILVYYNLSINFLNRFMALASAVLLIFSTFPMNRLFYELFFYMAFLCMFIYFNQDKRRYLFYTGLFLGIASMFKLYMSLAVIAAVIIFYILANLDKISFGKTKLKHMLLDIFVKKGPLMLLGYATVIAPVGFYLFNKGALKHFINNVLLVALSVRLGESGRGYTLFEKDFLWKTYPKIESLGLLSRDNPWDVVLVKLVSLLFYTPLIIYFFVACYLIKRAITYKRIFPGKSEQVIFIFLIFGVLSFYYGCAGTSEIGHFIKATIPAFSLGFFAFWAIYKFISARLEKMKQGQKYYIVKLLTMCLLVILPVFCFGCEIVITGLWMRYNNRKIVFKQVTYFVDEKKGKNVKEVVDYILKNTQSEESIFVIPAEPLIYFLTDRKNPTPFSWILAPGIDSADTDKVIHSLDRNGVRYIVLNPQKVPFWREKLSFDEYAPRLNDYIFDNYNIAKIVSDNWLILERK